MEFAGYLKFLTALLFVLGLIWFLAALARRMGFGFPVTAMKSRGNRRLSVVEVTPVDARRRLVLVRRDDTEHLILLGQTTELVIETGIPAKGGLSAPAPRPVVGEGDEDAS
jgi:flagellar protein FliO/FliZ